MRIRSILVPLAALVPCVFLPFFACGGEVSVPSTTTTTGTTTVTNTNTGTTTTTTGTTTTTTTTTGTTTTTTTGTTPPPTCVQTNDSLMIEISDPNDVLTADCGRLVGNTQTTKTVQAEMLGATKDFLKLNLCPPNANCFHAIQIYVDAPDLDLSQLPVGRFVNVTWSFSRNGTCEQYVVISHLAKWAGMTDSSNDADGLLYLAAEDGGILDEPGVAVGVKSFPLGCPGAGPNGCPDDYSLSITAQGTVGNPSFQMGATSSFTATAGDTVGDVAMYQARDLRSFMLDACNDGSNFAWWIVYRGTGGGAL